MSKGVHCVFGVTSVQHANGVLGIWNRRSAFQRLVRHLNERSACQRGVQNVNRRSTCKITIFLD